MIAEGTYHLAKLRGVPEVALALGAERDGTVASVESEAGAAPFAYKGLLSTGKTTQSDLLEGPLPDRLEVSSMMGRL